ncbi:MAG: PaaI family thioesterase [Spirosomataceae bacterium]
MQLEDTNPRLSFFRSLSLAEMNQLASGVTRWLGGELKEILPGKLVAEFVVREDMTNPLRTLHGGIAALIMDEMMGMMVYLLGNPYAHTSVNLNCDFLHYAPVGTKLIATATVIRKGKNIIHCESEIRNDEGKIIAKSSSNLVITSVPIKDSFLKKK